MPKVKNAHLVDTVLNEFVYTALYTADYQAKRGLPVKYQKASVDEKSAREFIDKSTRDEKEIVLALLGYEFFYVVHKSGKTFKQMKHFIPLLESKSALSKAASEEGFYVISDRDIVRMLGLMSGITHNPTFFLDMEIKRQGYNINKWEKRYVTSKDLTHRDIDENAKIVCKMIYGSLMLSQTTQFAMGVSIAGLSVLVYLYAFNILEITPEKLKENFVGRFSTREIANAIKDLSDESLISRLLGKISLTSLGIKKVNNIFHTIVHSKNI